MMKECEKEKYFEEHRQAEEAREELKNFLSTLPGKGFTVYQLAIIGSTAQTIVNEMIHCEDLRTVISANQIDLFVNELEKCVIAECEKLKKEANPKAEMQNYIRQIAWKKPELAAYLQKRMSQILNLND